MTDAVVDPFVLAQLTEQLGDAELVRQIVERYLAELPDRLAAIDHAKALGDPDALAKAAHTLKSPSLLVGATELGRACRTIEEAARRGELTAAVEASSALAALVAATRGALRQPG